MRKIAKDNIVMSRDNGVAMRIAEIAIGTLTFVAVFLTLFSGVSMGAAGLLSVLVGVPFSVTFFVFGKRKYVKLILCGVAFLYTVLCVAIGFRAFTNGFLSFINSASRTANITMHWGFYSYLADSSVGADFAFSSVVSVWLALGVSALTELSKPVMLLVSVAVTAVWICLGFFPAAYALILLAFSLAGLFITYNAMPIKAALCYVVVAVVVLGCAAPVFIYSGNGAVTVARENLTAGIERVFYGKNALPDGNLKNAASLNASDEVRLKVTVTNNTPKLYLKGFVGSNLEGDKWRTTDKNSYVQNEYQGLLDYVGREGLPLTQYARYSFLSGVDSTYGVTVDNVSASKKYAYVPYTLKSEVQGTQYYDLNLRNSIFSKRKYSFEVFGGDESSERVSQARWVIGEANLSAAQREYLEIEGEYRSFVYDFYSIVDDDIAKTIENSSFSHESANSIVNVTQVIRNYFRNNFSYSRTPDPVSNGFVSDFFGGNIKKANAAYFATAAAYIFRLYEFPSRYVEGYLLNAEIDGENATVPLTGRDGHAWVEVYLDGVGWLPIEVTPTYFSDKEVPDEPDDPKPDDPKPPEEEDPENPDPGEDPDPMPPLPPLTKEERNTRTAMKVLISVTSVLLAIMLAFLAVVIRRCVVISRRRKAIENAHGEDFGRTASSIMVKDLKSFGGFSEDVLEKFGVEREKTGRFIQLVERSVYGGYELSFNERLYVIGYVENATQAIISSGNFFHRIVCKYVKFIGIS